MGNLQREKSGRWTMRVGIKGKRYSRSTRTTDREKAEKFLQRFLGTARGRRNRNLAVARRQTSGSSENIPQNVLSIPEAAVGCVRCASS